MNFYVIYNSSADKEFYNDNFSIMTNYSIYNDQKSYKNDYKNWNNSIYKEVHIKIENLYRINTKIYEDYSRNKRYSYYKKEFLNNENDLMMAWEEYSIYQYIKRQIKRNYHCAPSCYSFIRDYYPEIIKYYCNVGNIEKFNKFFSLSVVERNSTLKNNKYFKDFIPIGEFYFNFVNNVEKKFSKKNTTKKENPL